MKNIKATVIKPGPLSPKEALVLGYLCEGYSRKEIAEQICRSESCINRRVESLADKLSSHSTAEIVATATALNIVRIELKRGTRGFFSQFVILLLCFNFVFGFSGLRPRSPRPIRTQNVARLVRASRQV